jgi:hypothetical protein
MVSSALASSRLTSSTNARAVLAMLVSMFLAVLWAALAVGAVLTFVFPERSLATSTMSGSSGSSWGSAGRTASVR